MKRHTSQSGSAHLVIMILLVVALLGALGVVFYQNFIAKDKKTPETPPTSQTGEALSTARLAFNSDIYEVDYPKDWKVVTTKPGGESTMTIASADQSVRVTINVSGAAAGGACTPNDTMKVRYYKVYPTTITKLTSAKLNVVEAMTDAEGGGYNYVIGLSPDGGETHAAVDDSHCTVQNVGIASYAVTDGATRELTQPTIIAKIDFPNLVGFPELADVNNTKIREMQQVKDILVRDEYKDAVKILESARKK